MPTAVASIAVVADTCAVSASVSVTATLSTVAVAVAPTVASTTSTIASTDCIARSAWSATACCNPLASGSHPPVSWTTKRRPDHSAS